MIHMQLARLIANQLIFLELCDDKILDPDSALKVMEMFLADVEALPVSLLSQIIAAFSTIAEEYDDDLQSFVKDIPVTFSLSDSEDHDGDALTESSKD